jgi:hypothetical protein
VDGTTERKLALVVGPAWWGDDWLTRAGTQEFGRDRAARARRVEEAAAEARGLLDQLDQLTAGVTLLLVGTSGVTRIASLWADETSRFTVRVPASLSQPAEAADALAVEVALAMAAAGWQVRVFACAATADDPSVVALQARGLRVRPVLPAVAASTEDNDTAPSDPV